MKTFKEYLAESQGKTQLNEYDTVPAGWSQWSGPGGKHVSPPKGNYQRVPSPVPGEPGPWYLLRPAPPTDLAFNPVKPLWWQPQADGGVESPQIGDDRMGTYVSRFVDKDGNIPASGTLNRWLKSLPQDKFDAWASANTSSGGDAGPRWAYEINPKYKDQIDKPQAASSNSNVKAIQDRILAADPNALPKYGADGKMGPETRAAMTRLGIKESLELQRILDIIKF